MDSLVFLRVSMTSLARLIQNLSSLFIKFGVSKSDGALYSLEVRSTFLDQIKAR